MKLSKSCYVVTGLGWSAPWYVNAGFVVGEEITLVVDTGGTSAAARSIHGYCSAVRSSNSLRVLNTEKHFDHIGGNGYFKKKGAEIWGHALLHRTQPEFVANVQEFSASIVDPVRRARHEENVFFEDTSLILPDHMIESEVQMDLGGRRVEILFTPGHTETNLSVWVPEDRVLFTGDCLVNGYLPNLDGGSVREWRSWLDSLARIEALRPAVVVPGHGQVAIGERVSQVIQDVRQTLHEAVAAGHSPTALPS
jgi:glyoxylase-like metal-dependent hydrolase (beta-lactamase superfamily II)